jgi:hypothetical protein
MAGPPEQSPTSSPVPRMIWIPALTFTSVLLLVLIVAFFLLPTMSPDQRNVLRSLYALLAGFAALFLGGTATVQMNLPANNGLKASVSAGGGIAVFLIVYMQAPYWFSP